MPRPVKTRVASEYEQEVDEIIAACRGDLRGAVKALMLINERLEQRVQVLKTGLIERTDDLPRSLLH